MNRRTALIVTVALAILLAPLVANAQQAGKVYRIGYLANTPPTTHQILRYLEVFRQGLRERGWVEGQNIVIEYRWADGRLERFPSLAGELVSLKVDIIVAVTSLGARAAKRATSTIPIVMVWVFDPVGQGLVASLGRPEGNVTGATFGAGPEIAGKYLELLKEAVPNLSRVAVLLTPDPLSALQLKETQAAAEMLAVKLQLLEVRNPNELEGAFASMTRERAGGLLVLAHSFTYYHAKRIVDLAAKGRLPAVFPFRDSVEAGGLMAYTASVPDMFQHAATYVDKILKGAKPGNLPVQQSTKFELVINLKTAKALGLTIPQSVLIRADEVIQ